MANSFLRVRSKFYWVPKTKHKLALLKKQERKSPYQKPALICEYEVHLQRADTLTQGGADIRKPG